ncbi:MAG: hypothetical protein R3346_02430 [Candidatus Spechtbacterales bacterium]|nr:hypothetical protein [Candidatus Spechtbacterales bacterium]
MSSDDDQHDEVPDIDDVVESLYQAERDRIFSCRDRFKQLIEEVTGWQGTDFLAELMVRTLVQNQGGSGDGSLPHRIRCACGNRPFNEEGEWSPEDII